MARVPQIPKFYWDSGYLSKLEAKLGDECIFLCLSPVSFRMLTDMTAMLLWATRYKEGVVPELGKTAYRELNVPCLTDFYSLLEELNNRDWLQSQFDELGSRMTELEDMDVNVTQTVTSCGCGCDGDTTSTTQTTSGGLVIDPADTGIIPPYMTDIIAVSDPIKCRSANYLAAKVISTIRTLGQIGDTSGTIAAIVFAIAFALTWLSPIIGDEVISTVILIRWAASIVGLGESIDFTFEYFSDLANLMDERVEEFVCILYDYDTSSELGSSMAGWIENTIEELRVQAGMPDIGASLMTSVLVSMFGANVVNWFVENVETIVPADFIPQYDCLCGATGDSCPTQNIVLAGIGGLIDGDLTGTTQGFGSTFNGQTGFYEIILEFAANYCVTIDNATYTPIEEHEKCSSGVMVSSDGSCIRRFVARSQTPFGTAVTFNSQTEDCSCLPSDVYVWLVGTAEGRDCPTDAHVFDSCEVDHFDSYGGRVSFYRILGVTPFTGNGLWIEADIPAGSSIELQVDNGLGLFENGLTKETAVSSGVTYFDFSSAVNFGGNSDSIPESFDVECKHIGNPEHPLIRSWGVY